MKRGSKFVEQIQRDQTQLARFRNQSFGDFDVAVIIESTSLFCQNRPVPTSRMWGDRDADPADPDAWYKTIAWIATSHVQVTATSC